MILLLALLAVGPVELQKPMDPYAISNVLGFGRALGGPPPAAFQRVAENPSLSWYSAGYFPKHQAEEWGFDTLEVVTKDGRRFRAVEQYAMTHENRIVPLAGRVSNVGLQRKPLRRGVGVVLFVAFRERFPLRSVASLEAR